MSILNKLPKVSTVFGCCDLRKGCLIVGGLYFPLGTTAVVLSILYANQLDMNADNYKPAYWSTIIFTIISVIDATIPMFLLFGILKLRPGAVLVSVGLLFITVILYIVNSVLGFMAGPIYGTIYFVTLIAVAYFNICVNSLYLDMK